MLITIEWALFCISNVIFSLKFYFTGFLKRKFVDDTDEDEEMRYPTWRELNLENNSLTGD
jgi:hypothetical protein